MSTSPIDPRKNKAWQTTDERLVLDDTISTLLSSSVFAGVVVILLFLWMARKTTKGDYKQTTTKQLTKKKTNPNKQTK